MPDLVIINGEEDFLKEKAVKDELSTRLINDVSYFSDKEIDLYLESINYPLMFGGSRAFVITECKQIPDLPSGSDLLIVVSSGKKKLSDSRATRSYDFPILKTYFNNNEVIKWIIKEGNAFNIDLSRVASALFINNGKSLRKLYSEIRKLAVLAPPGSTVTPELARSLLCFSAELTPKDIIESICEGNALKALAYHDKLQQLGNETGWIIAYMQRHVISHLKIELLLKQGTKKDDLPGILDIHPFLFKQTFERRIKLWSIDSLKNSLKTLCTLDLLHKKGSNAAEFGLESEIIRLSEEAKNVK